MWIRLSFVSWNLIRQRLNISRMQLRTITGLNSLWVCSSLNLLMFYYYKLMIFLVQIINYGMWADAYKSPIEGLKTSLTCTEINYNVYLICIQYVIPERGKKSQMQVGLDLLWERKARYLYNNNFNPIVFALQENIFQKNDGKSCSLSSHRKCSRFFVMLPTKGICLVQQHEHISIVPKFHL